MSKKGKPFFFRIDLIELMDFATEPAGMEMSLLQFSKELKKGKSDHPAIQKFIDEAHNYIEKKKKAGRDGGLAKRSSAKADVSSDLANGSTPLARNSSSSSTETETESTTATRTRTELALLESFDEKEETLKRVFPQHDFEVVKEAILAHYRNLPPPIDPYSIIFKWFQREQTKGNNHGTRTGGGATTIGTKPAGNEGQAGIDPSTGVKDFACGFPDRSDEW